MSDYESESEELLQIREQRGEAANVSLTPRNVQRLYFGLTPNRSEMAMSHPPSWDDTPWADLLRTLSSPTHPIGTGTTSTTSVPTSTTGVGVGTVSRPVTTRATTGVGTGTTTVSTATQPHVSAGTSSRSRSRRHSREGAALTATRRARTSPRPSTPVAAGPDSGGDSDGSSSPGSRRSRRSQGSPGGRRLGDDLGRLLDQLRRRTDGQHIAGITHTDTITTTYKDGRRPTVHRSSTRASSG